MPVICMDLGCKHPRLPAWICLALGVFLPDGVQLTEHLCVCGYKMQQVSSEGGVWAGQMAATRNASTDVVPEALVSQGRSWGWTEL